MKKTIEKAKVVRQKTRKDDYYNYTEWGAIKDGIIWATIYQGRGPFPKTEYDKTWCYVVRYVDDNQGKFLYEHYKTFKEAKKRAIEIAEAK
jgi:hypothetical protein